MGLGPVLAHVSLVLLSYGHVPHLWRMGRHCTVTFDLLDATRNSHMLWTALTDVLRKAASLAGPGLVEFGEKQGFLLKMAG